MYLIILIVIFFLDTSPPILKNQIIFNDTSKYYVYLVKQRWHTGFVFNKNAVDTLIWKEVNEMKNKNWIDVGWGDKDFYLQPGFDAELAFKAF